ncbi:MAG: 16S rRNA (uracil(1498)-N(3))-methyltransferase [Prevotellaceae bacterium]|jgi:16S rRNA (uracil1498-N3)-methyltransferase|nr:16S rRNA (uracil(1498)-N(3))-methyltransferase [Prevotellaceae bacterium]
MHIFYSPDITGTNYCLNESESRHCCSVLRLTVNDLIYLIDGCGNFYTAKIVDLSSKKCIVNIVDVKNNYERRTYRLHIAIAPTKSIDRFEWFLEKATEIGIDEITPIVCEHSERQILKIERLKKVIVAAAKQSVKAFLPEINEITDFKTIIEKQFDGKKLIAHCYDSEKIHLQKIIQPRENVLVFIGPEGDFSKTEIQLAKQNRFVEISLGKSRLRTETAAVHACSAVSLINES